MFKNGQLLYKNFTNRKVILTKISQAEKYCERHKLSRQLEITTVKAI